MNQSIINDGGPAFPAQLAFSPDGVAHVASEYYANGEGMSLRDYFAGQALTALINGTFTSAGAQNIELLAKIRQVDETSLVSQLAYEFADAMIETRNTIKS